MKKSFTSIKGDLIQQIKTNFPQINYNLIKTLFRKKEVKINGVRVNKNILLNGNELVELFLPSEKEKEIPVVYEDENIVVVFKPFGLETTVKDKTYNESKCLEEYFENCLAVHRLDKNTEGLVILAKTKQIFNQFVNIFKNKEISKFYKAITINIPQKQENLLVNYATKNKEKTIVLNNKEKNTVLIKTKFKVTKTLNNLALLDIELLTGFTHQIRAHLSFINCPILGDDKYGIKTINKQYKAKKQCLCAYKITFNIKQNENLSYLNNIKLEISPSFSLNDFVDEN